MASWLQSTIINVFSLKQISQWNVKKYIIDNISASVKLFREWFGVNEDKNPYLKHKWIGPLTHMYVARFICILKSSCQLYVTYITNNILINGLEFCEKGT